MGHPIIRLIKSSPGLGIQPLSKHTCDAMGRGDFGSKKMVQLVNCTLVRIEDIFNPIKLDLSKIQYLFQRHGDFTLEHRFFKIISRILLKFLNHVVDLSLIF